MIGKVAICKLSLLRLLPVIALITLAFAYAPKSVMAQEDEGGSLNGYTATGCNISHDDGDYVFTAYDGNGNPYYTDTSNPPFVSYMWAGPDDQERRNYYRWYIGSTLGNRSNDDYMTGNPCGIYSVNGIVQPVEDGPETVPEQPDGYDMFWEGDINGKGLPTVTLN